MSRALALALVLVATASAQSSPTGAIVSAQFACINPCEENWGLFTTRTDPVNKLGVENDVQLQQLLPYAPYEQRQFEVYTAYDDPSRTYVTVADGYPRVGGATVWASTLASGLDGATPLVSGSVVAYPVSTSPFPLNVEPLVMSRVVYGANGALLAIFTNGEVHRFDAAAGNFTKLLDLVPPDKQLGPTHPFATWAQAYDASKNSLMSVIFAASQAFAVETSLDTLTSGAWVELSYPTLDPEGTNMPLENFVNAHIMDFPDGTHNFVVTTESINDDQGFDQILSVNMTTGGMSTPVYNLMDYEIVLMCKPTLDCDKWRVSTWDQANYQLYFQGHSVQDDEIQLTINSLGFDIGVAGNLQWFVDEMITFDSVGYSGYQWATYQ